MSERHTSHEHGPSCSCGCHSHRKITLREHAHTDSAHALVDAALVLSKSWERSAPAAVAAAALAEQTAQRLKAVAERLAEDGAVMGHVKALLECGGERLGLSVTRTDIVDRTPDGAWSGERMVDAWRVTVNVLSLLHTDAVTEADLDAAFGG